jgi:hypothetical protein
MSKRRIKKRSTLPLPPPHVSDVMWSALKPAARKRTAKAFFSAQTTAPVVNPWDGVAAPASLSTDRLQRRVLQLEKALHRARGGGAGCDQALRSFYDKHFYSTPVALNCGSDAPEAVQALFQQFVDRTIFRPIGVNGGFWAGLPVSPWHGWQHQAKIMNSTHTHVLGCIDERGKVLSIVPQRRLPAGAGAMYPTLAYASPEAEQLIKVLLRSSSRLSEEHAELFVNGLSTVSSPARHEVTMVMLAGEVDAALYVPSQRLNPFELYRVAAQQFGRLDAIRERNRQTLRHLETRLQTKMESQAELEVMDRELAGVELGVLELQTLLGCLHFYRCQLRRERATTDEKELIELLAQVSGAIPEAAYLRDLRASLTSARQALEPMPALEPDVQVQAVAQAEAVVAERIEPERIERVVALAQDVAAQPQPGAATLASITAQAAQAVMVAVQHLLDVVQQGAGPTIVNQAAQASSMASGLFAQVAQDAAVAADDSKSAERVAEQAASIDSAVKDVAQASAISDPIVDPNAPPAPPLTEPSIVAPDAPPLITEPNSAIHQPQPVSDPRSDMLKSIQARRRLRQQNPAKPEPVDMMSALSKAVELRRKTMGAKPAERKDNDDDDDDNF